MKTNRRWLAAVIATSAKAAPGLPWQSSVRNCVPADRPAAPPAPVPVPRQPAAAAR